MKSKNDLVKKLNYSPLLWTNKTLCYGALGFPQITCSTTVYPDYIALYSQPCEYHKTENTCVAFYNYDSDFDGPKGLHNAIKYNNLSLLNQFKERFQGVKFFIVPDYSVSGDVQPYRNYYRMGIAREVGIWLAIECNAVIIPNLSSSRIDDFSFMLEGYEESSVVAISTKGQINDESNNHLTKEMVKYAVDHLKKLQTIIVYDVTCDDNKCMDIMRYAVEHNVKVIIPENILKVRNRIHKIRREMHA